MAPVVRQKPRVGATALAEYLTTAGSAKRRTIIENQKYPKAFMTTYYDQTRIAIEKYLAAGQDGDALAAEIERLTLLPGATDNERRKWLNNAKALGAFRAVRQQLGIDGMQVRVAPRRTASLVLAGVEVSVHPELLLTGRTARGAEFVGAMKLCLRAGEERRLTRTGGEYLGTLLHRHLADVHPDITVQHSACVVVDVFGEAAYVAPRAQARRLRDIEVACEDIALSWPVL